MLQEQKKTKRYISEYISNSYFIVSEDFMNKIGSYNSSTLYAQSQNASKLDEEVEQYKQENNFTQTDIFSKFRRIRKSRK